MLETQVETFPFHLVLQDQVRQGAHRWRYVLLERWPHLPQEELQEPLEGFLLVGRAGHRFSFLERPETAGAWQEVYTTLNHRLERLCSRASWGGRALAWTERDSRNRLTWRHTGAGHGEERRGEGGGGRINFTINPFNPIDLWRKFTFDFKWSKLIMKPILHKTFYLQWCK